jgi:ABC-type antimicrobial peptide transport system permease subunit
VAQRRREFGIRMALGASGGCIVRGVLGRAGRLVGAGILAGALGAAGTTRVLHSVLYGVRATDPSAYVAGALLLGAAGLLAAWLPAARAARVDPAATMRAD